MKMNTKIIWVLAIVLLAAGLYFAYTWYIKKTVGSITGKNTGNGSQDSNSSGSTGTAGSNSGKAPIWQNTGRAITWENTGKNT